MDEICAIIPADNMVHFYNKYGDEIYLNTLPSKKATEISWSPTSRYLAIGWSDGCITLWSQGQTYDSENILKGPVNMLEWHPNSPILLSTAKNGNICVWDCSSMILPLFKASKPDTTFQFAQWVPKEMPFAYITSSDGTLYSLENQSNALTEISKLSLPIHYLFSSVSTRRLIIIHGENELTQFSFPPGNNKLSNVKLPAGDPPFCIAIRNDVLCYSINDAIYIWNVQNDETHILRAPQSHKITSLHFDHISAELYATTKEGSIISWKCTMKGLISRVGWSNPHQSDCGFQIENATWSPYVLSFIAICTGRRPLIFRHNDLKVMVNSEAVIWQPTPDQIMMKNQQPIKISSTVERASISGSYVLVSTQNNTEIFTIRSGGLVPFSRISLETSLVSLSGEEVYDCKESSLECRNLQGTIKQTTNLGNSTSKYMEINGKYLIVLCTDNNIFLYDISRRTPKLIYNKTFELETENEFRIRSISLSCGGFSISFTIDIYENGIWKPSTNLYLHSPQFDKIITLQFEGRIPTKHLWDTEDPRLLCIETIPYGPNFESTMTGTIIYPIFVADNLDTYRQSTLQIEDGKKLCTVIIPRIYYTSIYNESKSSNNEPSSSILPQFEGLDNTDEQSKKAIMELNFHLATGDIDSAFNSIRGIDNKATWRSLAQTCAQSRRIDLADLCFGRMEDGASALLLHNAKKEDSDETTSIVVVDSQLGLYNEAKSAAKDKRRFDLLANIYESLSEWKEAMNIVNSSDRIHLKVMAYNNARSLELRGELQEAIEKYEMSGTIQNELPRLSLQANDLKIIFNYITEHNPSEIHPKLFVWIGRFYEAHKQYEQAIEYYDLANNQREIIRLYCCIGEWDKALTIVKKSNQRSVICYYARILMKRIDYYSKPGNEVPQIDVNKMKHEVIELFKRARQFSQAMDIALQYEMIDDILSLSFSAPSTLVCKAARWFEEQKEAKNAILLYSRAGRLNRALALCFTMKQYDALDEISDNLTSKTDTNILLRCGKYFMESERWSKAAQCYALAQQFDIVIDLCNKHNIKLQSSIIQELSELKADPEIMKRFASLCEQQGAFTTAATLYVKFKDHLSAMKALIRSGDTNKVIKFANLMRKRETYILAANYLQTFNPRKSDTLFNVIVNLYKKANALDKLGRFYEASAQVEIDEYQEYEVGLDLMKKGLELIMNVENMKNKEQYINVLKKKIKLIEKYLQAQSLIENEPKKAIVIASELLKIQNLETFMRQDDVYMILVKASVKLGKYKEAYAILEELRNNGTDLSWFMKKEELQKIYEKAGAEYVDEGNEEYDDVDDEEIDEIGDIDVDDNDGN
ncbi:intraflagellar transport protein [Histomonas meleagridis]|uniref:intraflagellar transport protein n=1 Tax=Histomonas meleagridis TaxID=135588 RepID=UPI00355989B9|nr:intraflagellar transport protein [Histomonas meleagridis]KAH0798658.1 intraflagellar transport protein [Histomonas meleagridis]